MTPNMETAKTRSEKAIIAKTNRILRRSGRFKERSFQTSRDTHLPLLQSMAPKTTASADGTLRADTPVTLVTPDSPSSTTTPPDLSSLLLTDSPEVVLLGDSLIERMLTAGTRALGHPLPCLGEWPPETLMTRPGLYEALPAAKAKRIPNVLNLGVGGDKIQNLILRMVGQKAATESEPRSPLDSKNAKESLEGYFPYFVRMKSVKLWVIHVGSNNLRKEFGLGIGDLNHLYNLMGCLLMIPSNDKGEAKSRLLLTGLFPRADPDGEKVDFANQELERIVRELNVEMGTIKGKVARRHGQPKDIERVVYLPPSETIGDKDKYFTDNVNLNYHGYKLWLKELVPKVVDLLTECPE